MPSSWHSVWSESLISTCGTTVADNHLSFFFLFSFWIFYFILFWLCWSLLWHMRSLIAHMGSSSWPQGSNPAPCSQPLDHLARLLCCKLVSLPSSCFGSESWYLLPHWSEQIDLHFLGRGWNLHISLGFFSKEFISFPHLYLYFLDHEVISPWARIDLFCTLGYNAGLFKSFVRFLTVILVKYYCYYQVIFINALKEILVWLIIYLARHICFCQYLSMRSGPALCTDTVRHGSPVTEPLPCLSFSLFLLSLPPLS